MIWPEGWHFNSRAQTSLASHYRLHSHHRGAPPHHRSSVGFGMWAAWHPCHGWKSGNLEILQLEKVTANLPQISPKHFEASMATRPKLLVCSVEYLADSQVDVDHPICQLFNFFSGTERDSEDPTLTSWNSTHRLHRRSTSVLLLLFQCCDGVPANQS